MFISFRPNEKIIDEISITAGYVFNKKNLITAKSGKKKYKFDITGENFAWIADGAQEKKMIKTMKKGSRIMITGYNLQGSQTIDHYSLLAFTKAYKATKANCDKINKKKKKNCTRIFWRVGYLYYFKMDTRKL